MTKNTKVITILANTKQKDPIFLHEEKMVVVLQEGATATIFDHDSVHDLTFHVHAKSKLNFFTTITQTGSKNISIFLHGQFACAHLNGAYLLSDDQTCSLHVRQEHLCPNTESHFVLRGALAGTADVSINGMIFIDKQAEKTKASHQNKTILLSSGTQVQSCPDLAVLNKNVRCSHGSAIGKFDEAMLFYVCSRGLTKKMAKRHLLQSFLASPFEQLKDKKRETFLKPMTKKLQEMV